MSVERIMAAPVMAQVPASASASDNAWATGDSPAAKEHLRHREFRNQSAWLGLPVGAATGAATGVAISEAMRKIRGGKISPFYSRMSSNGTIGTLLGIAGAVTGIITGYSITHAKMQKHQDVPVGALVQTGEVKGLSPVKNDYVEGDTIGYVVGSDAEDSGIIRKYNVENTYTPDGATATPFRFSDLADYEEALELATDYVLMRNHTSAAVIATGDGTFHVAKLEFVRPASADDEKARYPSYGVVTPDDGVLAIVTRGKVYEARRA